MSYTHKALTLHQIKLNDPEAFYSMFKTKRKKIIGVCDRYFQNDDRKIAAKCLQVKCFMKIKLIVLTMTILCVCVSRIN